MPDDISLPVPSHTNHAGGLHVSGHTVPRRVSFNLGGFRWQTLATARTAVQKLDLLDSRRDLLHLMSVQVSEVHGEW